ncbi:SCP2 sterol-binding domain-containing protein [Neiella marina]|uniref:Ubiquinone biosynthesis accessory factor UbiT n=1 Tax=Neiella holothuriorum TaxID=2870530 RepID=A0ABS7EEI6_9GAMM|nr:SCP2 sterol-binding domain-containing protein [Neiella holothuriorum]MBW8190665.1 SCP2 sterol-binding domain-containing protein [Neiella holothuriorum]
MLKQLLHRAVNHAPQVLRLPLQKMPFSWYCRPLELALQQLLNEQVTEGELDFLDERTVQVHVTDLGLRFVITVLDDQLKVLPPSAQAEVTFAGASPDLLMVAARRQDPDTLFFRRKLSIEGDTELGLAAKNMLDAVDWDQLPKLLMLALDKTASLVEQAQQSEQAESPQHAQSANA